MGRKIFISYKYSDSDVKLIKGEWWETNTVRNYVDEMEQNIDSSDHIYKAESDGEDLSELSESTIWERLKNRIYDSTLTIVLISKNMMVPWKLEKNQWIPREISYSLKEVSRINKNGNPITSKSNAILAVVIPDKNNSYEFFTYKKNCCDSKCKILKIDTLYKILKKNMFNLNEDDKCDCESGITIYYGDYNYISVVEWGDFIGNMNKYMDKAYEIQGKIDKYDIYKEVE